MHARYYDPKLARFISPDPVTPLAGGASFFNRYAYGFNSPYVFKDINGEEWINTGTNDSPTWEWRDFPGLAGHTLVEENGDGTLNRYPVYDAVVTVNGSTSESLSNNGLLTGNGANPAEIVMFCSNGEVGTVRGLSVSSDPAQYPRMMPGNYLMSQKRMASSHYKNGAYTYRISQLDGNMDIIPVGYFNINTKLNVITEVFMHRSNYSGYAGASNSSAVSSACLLFDARQRADVDRLLGTSQNIFLQINRRGENGSGFSPIR